jgi:hypothetical protein
MTVPKGTGRDAKSVYVDRSIVYKDSEEAVVQNVVVDRNEDAMRFAKVGLRKVRPVAIGDKFCLTGDHEVLTSKGWKNIKLVTVNDSIATLNGNTLEWHVPSEIVQFDHTGEMYEIQNGLIDLKTTMNHKMYVKHSSNGAYALEEAKDLIGKYPKYKLDCVNENKEVENIELSMSELGSPTYEVKSFNMNDWLTLAGIYITEGFCGVPVTIIEITNRRTYNTLIPLLNRMGISYENNSNTVRITDKLVGKYLRSYMDDITNNLLVLCKTLGKNNIQTLIDALVAADGCYGRDYIDYYTDGKVLADILQMLAIMAGLTAEIKRNVIDSQSYINVTLASGTAAVYTSKYYRIRISYDDHLHDTDFYGRGKASIDNQFNGKVYCVNVHNHVFMVRRNDKYCWTGNSSRSG